MLAFAQRATGVLSPGFDPPDARVSLKSEEVPYDYSVERKKRGNHSALYQLGCALGALGALGRPGEALEAGRRSRRRPTRAGPGAIAGWTSRPGRRRPSRAWRRSASGVAHVGPGLSEC